MFKDFIEWKLGSSTTASLYRKPEKEKAKEYPYNAIELEVSRRRLFLCEI